MPTSKNNIANNSRRGSIWRKWDLHVHTPDSYDWAGGQVTPTDLVDTAISTSLAVIAITDHHNVGWIDQTRAAAKGKPLTVLPGLELRTDKGNKGIHIIGIFPERTKAQFLHDKILAPLNFTDADIAVKGNDKVYCPYEKACDLIHDHGGLVFLHAGKKHAGIEQLDSDTQSLLKKDMGNLVDVLELSAPKQAEAYRNIVFKAVGRKWPMIITSDSVDRSTLTHKKGHSLEVLGKAFTWIKADTTFEGLRQIVYEPNLRVSLDHDDPVERETYARIDECQVSFPEKLKFWTEVNGSARKKKKTLFCFHGAHAFAFSNNLTCLIGGRGSGKSTLTHVLYNKSPKREDGRLSDINSPLRNLDLEPEPLAKLRALTTVDVPENTEFFLQNEIEKQARSVEEMSSLIHYRLERLSAVSAEKKKRTLPALRDDWKESKNQVDELVSAYDDIARTDKHVDELQKRIDTLRKQTGVIKSDEYQKYQKAITEVGNEIAVFDNYQREHNDLSTKIRALEKLVTNLDWDQQKGDDILKTFVTSLSETRATLADRFQSVKDQYDSKNYPEELQTRKDELAEYLKGKGLSAENVAELAGAAEQITDLTGQIEELKRSQEEPKEIFDNRDDIIETYKNAYSKYATRSLEVAGILEAELGEISAKTISFEQQVSHDALKRDAAQFVKEQVSRDAIRIDEIQNVLFDVSDPSVYINKKATLPAQVNKSQKAALHKKVVQELVNDDVFLERLYLRLVRSFFDLDNIQVQTKLGEKLLQNTSFGERCGIVITIALLVGTNPMVIDQPEDNLDGRFISEVLVRLIRKQKHNRQIILVTRDANIAIGSDAELLLILEEKAKGTIVTEATIEDVANREKYIWILDGGEDAFKKREQKYRIPGYRFT